MRLVERRIGLLFALFLCSSRAADARATWLGTVKAGGARRRAPLTQQVEDLDVPARRGTIIDRHGVELAVSEDAVTVFANPFLIKNPARVGGAGWRRCWAAPRTTCSRSSATASTGFVYLRRKIDAVAGQKVEKLKIEGIGTVVEPQAHLSAGRRSRRSCSARWAPTNYGLSGLEQSQQDTLSGDDGKRRLVKDALGRAGEHRRDRARASRARTCA